MQSTEVISLNKITNCALFTALMAILAQFSIQLPFSPIPFSGQVLGIFLAITVLDRQSASLAVLSYILLGAAGAPVFSMARGGLFMLIGPTGGYLWGFLPAVIFGAWIMEKSLEPTYLHASIASVSSLFTIYLCGAIQLMIVLNYSFLQAISLGVLPFIPLDIFKVYLAIVIGLRVRRQLKWKY